MKAILALFIFWFAATPAVQAQLHPSHLIAETLRYRMLSGPVEVGSSVVTSPSVAIVSPESSTSPIDFQIV